MYYLGVDLGGTNIKAALVDADGAIIKEASTPTKLPRPAEAVCDDIAALCNQLAQGQQVAGIGVGCPGTVDGGLVRYSNNLDWHDFAMGDYLRAKTGLPVALANDANAAALGEALAGCAKGAESAVIITLGTGVGGGVLRDVLSNQKPYIFVKHFYACPTLIGALLCALCWQHLGDIPSMLLGAAVILVLRLCAAHFRWGLPHAADLPE
jgi:glucokinase